MNRSYLLLISLITFCQFTYAATYTVINTNDAGPGSLRQAINDANANTGVKDLINFAIPGTAPYVITLSSPLPVISEQVTIDGYSEPGAYQAAASYPAKILVVVDFASLPNSGFEFTFTDGSSDITGLSIVNATGSGSAGIYLNNCGVTNIKGNYIGVYPGGTAGSNYVGIKISGSDNCVIGATLPDANPYKDRNIISSSTTHGILIENSGDDEASSNVITYNYIGTDITGMTDMGNTLDGIHISVCDNTVITNNVISGNDGNGINLEGTVSNPVDGTIIENNLIGLKITNSSLGNSLNGILLNYCSNTNIGGPASSFTNIIAYNGQNGIAITGNSSIRNDIFYNSNYLNSQLGIDLGNDGVTANDSGDGDTGPNELENFPVIDSAVVTGTTLTVYGKYNGAAGTHRLEFFNNPQYILPLDASGYGEGYTPIGTKNISVATAGTDVPFNYTFNNASIYKDYITATATSLSSNSTSEFSAYRQVTAPKDYICRNGFPGVTRTYSIPAVAGATSYTWSVPAGAVISAPSNTNTVTVTFNTTANGNYDICVTADNNCGSSPNSCFPVLVYTCTFLVTKVQTSGPNPVTAAWQVLGYTISVINNGNIALTGVVPTETYPGAGTGTLSAATESISTNGILNVGETWTYTASYTVTQADMDAGTELANNISIVTTEIPGPTIGTETTTTTQSPALTTVKVSTTDPNTYAAVGDEIDYSITVTNTGNVTITGINLTDPNATVSCAAAPYTLAPTQSFTCTAVHTVDQADLDAGLVTNTATASGKDPNNEDVTDPSDPVTVNATQTPSIAVIKAGTLNMTLISPATRADVGDVINYTFQVTNTGNTTLTGVSITDPLVTVSGGPITLAPGATDNSTFSAVYTLLQADINAGTVTNTATASGTPPSGPAVTGQDDDTQVYYTVAGTVFDDANGMNNTFVDGTGTNAAGIIYMNLVDNNTNQVIASVLVNPDGTYFFTMANGVLPNTTYNLILTTSLQTAGNTLLSATYPSNWIPTGENNSTGAGNDGTINGILTVNTNNGSAYNSNFGIEQLPNTNNISQTYYNPGGSNTVLVPVLNGTDPEDCVPYGSCNTGHEFILGDAPAIAMGNLYYSGVLLTSGSHITNFNPALLTFDPADGNIIATFTYSLVDAAGNADPTRALATLTFNDITLSGNIYDDANGMNSGNMVDGTGIGTASGNQLYASIVAGGTVVQTVAVAADGTYTFINLNNTLNYSVILTTANVSAGNLAPSATLPVGWVNTGEINNNATNSLTGNDGTTNGIVVVGVITGPETNINFGIEQPPLAGSNTLASQENPEGTVNITVPSTLFTGSDFSLGTVTSIVISAFPVNATSITINGITYSSGTFPPQGVTVPANSSGNPTQIITVDPVDGYIEIGISYVTVDNAGMPSPPAVASLPFYSVPSITCPSNKVINVNPGNCNGTASETEAVYFDYDVIESLTWTMTGATTASSPLNGINNISSYIFGHGVTTITYTVTNIHGYSATCSFTVTVMDNEAPEIVCPGDYLINTDPGLCSAVFTYIVTASDNCTLASLVQVSGLPSGAAFPVGATTNIFEAIDESGNVSTCTFTIIVEDHEAPVIVCPSDITVNASPGQCEAFVTIPDPYLFENCGNSTLTNSYNNGTHASGIYPVGTTNILWTFSDEQGNVATCSMTVTVVDNQAPLITCPENITVNAAPGQCQANITIPDLISSDNCGIASIINNYNNTSNASGIYPAGITWVTWSVTDIHGNTSSCVMSVTVNDNQGPTISCPANINVNASNGQCGAMVTVPAPNTGDNCGVVSVINDFNGTADASGYFPVGTTTILWTVTDVSGKTASCSMTVTVIDNQNPTITCPANIVVGTNAGQCQANITVSVPIVSDNCGVLNFTNNFNGTGNASGIYPLGTTTVNWIVTDIHGRTSSCSMTVTVTDTEIPSITCPANITVNAAPGQCQAMVTVPVPIVSDNCGIAALTNNINGLSNASGFYPAGTTPIIWTVTDVHGLTNTCTMTVTVIDNLPPTISCPSNIVTVTDPGVCQANVTVPLPLTSDNCGVASVINNKNNTADASGIYPVGTTVVVWTVTDNSGKTATCSMTVTVNDNQNPIIICPANIVQSVGTGCTAEIIVPSPVTSDNCGILSVTNSINGTANASGTYPFGTTYVMWTVTDIHGHSSSCMMSVTVIDNTPPSITCPGNISVPAAPGSCQATVNIPVPVVNDDCGINLIINNYNGTDNASGAYPVGTTTVTWTVMDIHGNINTCSMNVTVIDNQAPVLQCPPDMVRPTSPGQCQTFVNVPGPAVHDNCGIASMINSVNGTSNASGIYPVGTTTISWTVTDIHGNTATCSMTVTVVDHQKPTITCPANVVRYADPGQCSANVTFGSATAADNCGVASIINNHNGTSNASGVYPVGSTTVLWTATDIHGNFQTCSMTVTVIDNQPPVITCPANLTVNAANGLYQASITNLGNPQTSDNCGIASVTNNGTGIYPVGINEVVWTATDTHGNTATCVQTVTVVDNQPPTITCPPAISIPVTAGSCTAPGTSIGIPVTHDNCGVTSVTNNAPANLPLGSTNITWTVADAAGNTAVCSQAVTVIDNQPPAITCPPDVVVNTDQGLCQASNVSLGTPVTSDNCSVVSVTNNGPAVYPKGVTVVTWTVTDGSGNTSNCTQNVTVVDNQPPVITCPPAIQVNANPGSCLATNVVLGTPLVSDNCTNVTVSNNAPTTFNLGVTTVTWTATDASGHMSTCDQLVTVVDNQAPTVTCPADVHAVADPGSCFATNVALGNPVASDNCSIATVTNNAPSFYPTGNTYVMWTVKDGSGNTATCLQTVTVSESEPPVISCPADVTLFSDALTCGVNNVDLGIPVASDHCSSVTVTNNAPAFFPVGETTVIWTATDDWGNTASCLQHVTVIDNIPPQISCPATITVYTDPGDCFATQVDLGQATATDNCGIASLTHSSLNAYPLGTSMITWTATDIHGNSSTCEQIITVVDQVVPAITCPPGFTVNTDPGQCFASNVTLGEPLTSDNCSVVSVVNNAPEHLTAGPNVITWTVTDGSGNISTCEQVITVIDPNPPTILAPPNITVVNDPGECSATDIDLGTPTISDECSNVIYYNDGYETFLTGNTIVTWTAIDASGNVATAIQIVTVIDTEPPHVNCQPDIVSEGESEVTVINPLVSDNCGIASIINDFNGTGDASGTYPLGTTPVTFTATDINGNTSTCIEYVTINCELIAYNDTVVIPFNDSTTVLILQNDTLCGQPVECNNVTIIYQPNNITVEIDTITGRITCIPVPGFIGIDSVQYEICCVATRQLGKSYSESYMICDSAWIIVTVMPPPTAHMSGSTTICSGGMANLVVTMTGTPPFMLKISDGINIFTYSGLMTNLAIIPVNPIMTTTYFIASVTDATTLSNTGMGSATISIISPQSFIVTGGGTFCPGSDGVTIGLSGSETGAYYQLFVNGSPVTGPVQGTGMPLNFGIFDGSGIYTVTATLGESQCQTNMYGQAFASLLPGPEAFSVTGGGSCCFGCTDIHVGLNGSVQGTYYQLYLNDSILVTGLWGTGLPLDFGYVTETGIYTVIATNSYGCAQVMTHFASAELWPKPHAELATPDITLCEGSALHLTVNLPSGTAPWCIEVFDGTTTTTYCDIPCSPFILEVSPAVSTTYTLISVTDAHGCMDVGSGSTTVTILPGPVATLTAFDTLCSIDAPILLTGGTPPGGYFVGTGVTGNYFNPQLAGPGTFTISYIYSNANGCTSIAYQPITVNPCTNFVISGNVNYFNVSNTPMNNTTVTLKHNNTLVATTTTNASGYFEFTSLPAGSYTLSASTTKNWGGVNSTDALLILQHFVNLIQLSGIQLQAADVDHSSSVNSVDALMVAKRFVHQINSFPVGNWIFETPDVTLADADETVNLKALCYGDVNRSYQPPSFKIPTTVELNNSGYIEVSSFHSFELPISTEKLLNAAAMSLILYYPEDDLEVTGVRIGDKDLGRVQYHTTGGELRISWYDLQEMQVQAGSEVLRISLMARDLSKYSDGVIAMSIEGSSEIADLLAQPLLDVQLSIPKLVILKPQLSVEVYPNPITDHATFDIHMPEVATVDLMIYDALGNEVAIPAKNSQLIAGNHSIDFDASRLPQGVYIYKMLVNGSIEKILTGRIVITR